jgi:hypothetical protein
MELVTILGSIALGVALAASCGLRAFLPLFVLGLAARLGFVDVGEHFAWLTHAPALLALAVAVLAETLGDKVPWLNHLLDLLATPARTIAGMLVCAAVVVDLPIWVVALLAIIVGGGVALAVHVAKGGARLASSAATGGASSPAHSFVEDIACLASTVLSLVFTLIALAVALGGVWLLVVLVKRWRAS